MSIVDLVGYGTTASCSEGGTPASAPGNSTVILRREGGCTDSGTNANDFTIGTPQPRNTASQLHPCMLALLNVDFRIGIIQIYVWPGLEMSLPGLSNGMNPK
jgi:hypothetical protein